MTTNKVIITDNMIEFSGFELLHRKTTISLLHSGITISPGFKKDNRTYYYEVVLDSYKRTYDEILIHILRDRGLPKETNFICINNSHYIEVVPHSVKK